MNVFDRRLVRRNRDRAAARFAAHDFLFREVAERLADRLDDVKRQFPSALDLGSRGSSLAAALGGRGGVETLVQCELAPAMAGRSSALRSPIAPPSSVSTVCADEELLPFRPNSFDLVLSNLDLHWVNDLPGCLLQIRHALKPDGLLLASMLGGRTLAELRASLTAGEIAVSGGASPRVSPFADLPDAGALLQRAGFALPVVDSDIVMVTYDNAFHLMRDLRGMAETNAVLERRHAPTRRATLFAAAAHYRDNWASADGRVPATFQVIYLTAWAPDASQRQALRPGSAQLRLADALGAREIPAGDKAGPR